MRRSAWTRAAAAALLGMLASCSSSSGGMPRVQPGEHVTPELAAAATRAEDWELAAGRWNELFLRGGDGATAACRETAYALLRMGELESAKSVLDLGLRNDEGHPELLEMRGNVLAAMGFRRAAEGCYLAALEADPDHSAALLGLGRVRVELQRQDAALEPLERRLQSGARDGETCVLYARALAACGRPAEAFDAFRDAIESGQADPMCLVAAAAIYLDPRLLGTDPERRDLVLEWLLLVVEEDPQNTLAHLYLGRLHEAEGNDGQALARYRRAVETDPGHAEALTRMAFALERLDDPERAAVIAAAALEFQRDLELRSELERLVAEAPVEE